jgi:hypothetical protein
MTKYRLIEDGNGRFWIEEGVWRDTTPPCFEWNPIPQTSKFGRCSNSEEARAIFKRLSTEEANKKKVTVLSEVEI